MLRTLSRHPMLSGMLGLVWLTFASPLCSQAQEPPVSRSFFNAMSLQGFTGILNTPNAHVAPVGTLSGCYGNQSESNWEDRRDYQDNYLLSVGFLDFAEGAARLTVRSGTDNRDLSANVKLSSAALTAANPAFPVLALGMQDVSGGAALLQTKYAVVSSDLWRFRVSAGYGLGPDRMKGSFGGVEFKAHDWVYLLGEYDTRETNLGLRLVTPERRRFPLRFTATLKTSLDYRPGNIDLLIGVTLPLSLRGEPARSVQSQTDAAGRGPAQDAVPGKAPVSSEAPPPAAPDSAAAPPQASPPTRGERWDDSLQEQLARQGFLNVRVGSTESGALVVEYENTVFNHNELDALGVVAGFACRAAKDRFDVLRLVVKRRGITVATVTMPTRLLEQFLETGQRSTELQESVVVEYGEDRYDPAHFSRDRSNGSLFNTSLILAPSLTTFIGTEVGVFDYLLSLKPEINTQLWKGAVAVARWELPISWSENLDEGRTYSGSRRPTQMDRLMLFQAVKPAPSVLMQLGAGLLTADRFGFLNEAVWTPGGGDHRFRVAQGWSEDDETRRQSDLLIGSYRYFHAPLDLSLEIGAGKFWASDNGYIVELKRFWEDTAVSFYYKDSKGEDSKKWRAVGIQFSLPLTPRKDMKPVAKLQVRGTEEWSYAQETTLKNNNYSSPRGSLNYMASYPLTINPLPPQALYRSYLNRDRLTPSYVRQHLSRLREAWDRYAPYPDP